MLGEVFIMAKESIKIELDEDDVKKLVAEKYNLDVNSTSISITHFNGDAREASYTSIIVTGKRDNAS